MTTNYDFNRIAEDARRAGACSDIDCPTCEGRGYYSALVPVGYIDAGCNAVVLADDDSGRIILACGVE